MAAYKRKRGRPSKWVRRLAPMIVRLILAECEARIQARRTA